MFTNCKILFCTYFKSLHTFKYNLEIYGEYNLFCVKSGKFAYSIDDKQENIISAGEMLLCPPGKKMSRKIIEPTEFCMIKFNPLNGNTFPSQHIKIHDILRFNYNMERLENCIFCNNIENFPVFAHYCRDIIYMINKKREDEPLLITRAHKYIEQNYNQEISIGVLAAESGYSAVHFINKFKQHYNCTPKEYINVLRLQKAKTLLSSTDKFSREIAYLCGFNDELYFIRFFKKHTGMTPKQFRKYQI